MDRNQEQDTEANRGAVWISRSGLWTLPGSINNLSRLVLEAEKPDAAIYAN
ncbi:hypothetical protein [Hoeflea sp.]|uniref:hypothetical protein n=1 Tax=Hoeflea sp. TaxID=1940281 RepID=UPI0037480788